MKKIGITEKNKAKLSLKQGVASILLLFIGLFSFSSCVKVGQHWVPIRKIKIQDNRPVCEKNADETYIREDILCVIADTMDYKHPVLKEELNENIRSGNKLHKPRMKLHGFGTTKNRPFGFFVYDLVDTTNLTWGGRDKCIHFIEKHIYVFGTVLDKSVLHGVVLLNKEIHFFYDVNIKNETLINFVISNDLEIEEALLRFRIKNYKLYRYLASLKK